MEQESQLSKLRWAACLFALDYILANAQQMQLSLYINNSAMNSCFYFPLCYQSDFSLEHGSRPDFEPQQGSQRKKGGRKKREEKRVTCSRSQRKLLGTTLAPRLSFSRKNSGSRSRPGREPKEAIGFYFRVNIMEPPISPNLCLSTQQ